MIDKKKYRTAKLTRTKRRRESSIKETSKEKKRSFYSFLRKFNDEGRVATKNFFSGKKYFSRRNITQKCMTLFSQTIFSRLAFHVFVNGTKEQKRKNSYYFHLTTTSTDV